MQCPHWIRLAIPPRIAAETTPGLLSSGCAFSMRMGARSEGRI